jgi:predicted nucleotidyltransferase
MTAKHGLTDKTLAQIAGVLARFAAVETAILFGSRAKGTHKPGSDIDLALTGDQLDWRTIGRIDSSLDDLALPYTFSLIMFNNQTDPEVAAHIRRVGILLFEKHAPATR